MPRDKYPMFQGMDIKEIEALFLKIQELINATGNYSERVSEALNKSHLTLAERTIKLVSDWENKRVENSVKKKEDLENQAILNLYKRGLDVQNLLFTKEYENKQKLFDAETDPVRKKEYEKYLEEKKDVYKESLKAAAKEEVKMRKQISKETEKLTKAQHKRELADLKSEALRTFNDITSNSSIVNPFKFIQVSKQLKADHPDMSKGDITKAVINANAQVLSKETDKLLGIFEDTINSIAESKTLIDTRLQGWGGVTERGSYWDAMNNSITNGIGWSTLVTQQSVTTNLKDLIGRGIAYNVEQRALIASIKDEIATTFDTIDNTLLRLVRIQQEDSTAARLGMESALTSFLNNMYETSEYMSDIAGQIRADIAEASALMTAQDAVSFEYQVQKWLGSLYSVGFSSTAAQGLAGALGNLAAGNIDSITQGGYGNLLVMAANRANLSIADILANGLDDSETNLLLKSAVEYLGEIYSETKDSNVVAQQLASVYGVTAADLKAAYNLAGSTTDIANNNLNYSGMLSQLMLMANSAGSRVSTGQQIQNLMSNFKYSTSSTIANNPALYSTVYIASLVKDLTGGGNIPFVSAMGTGVDLATTIADLILFGSLGTGMLGSIGSLIGGLSNDGSGLAGILKAFNVGNTNVVSRGTGSGLLTTVYQGVSESGYVGNSEGSDVYNKALTDARSDANNQLVEAVDTSDETKLSTVDEHIVQIYNLLQNVVNGTDTFRVICENTPLVSYDTGL